MLLLVSPKKKQGLYPLKSFKGSANTKKRWVSSQAPHLASGALVYHAAGVNISAK